MDSKRRMVAHQLAEALRAALPTGTFDETSFLDELTEYVDGARPHRLRETA